MALQDILNIFSLEKCTTLRRVNSNCLPDFTIARPKHSGINFGRRIADGH